MTHCTSTIVAFRFVWSAGNATLTTVLSMKAMLEARMVAARTQRPRDFEQGAVSGPDRITFSSQGSRRTAHIFPIQPSQADHVTVELAIVKAAPNRHTTFRPLRTERSSAKSSCLGSIEIHAWRKSDRVRRRPQ